MYDILMLNVVAAFKSPKSDVCLYVDNQPGFDYVTLDGGRWVTEGGLHPVVKSWLTETDHPTVVVGPNWENVRLNDFPLGLVEWVVHYGSIHHRDER